MVLMPMMQIGVMRVPVDEASMPVPMRMRLTLRIVRAMVVLMMLVVTMPMFMLHRCMKVFMLVPLGQMQPAPKSHESARGEQLEGQRLSQQGDSQQSAHKRC